MKNLREQNAEFLRKKHEERKQDIIDFNRSCLSELNQRFNIIEVDQKTLFVPKAEADIYASDQSFNELLYTAFGTKDSQMVDAFLAYKETCEKVRKDKDFHPQTIHLDFSYKNPSGASIALLCLWMNDDALFKLALEKGADIHADHKDNMTLLHNAVLDKNIKCSKTLLKRGAQINCQNIFGLTPLMICASNYQAEIFDLLLAKDSPINTTSINGENSLTIGAHYDLGIDAMKKLLKKGAHLDAYNNKNDHGPLSYAIANNNKKLVELLVSYGANTKHSKVLSECHKLSHDNAIRQILTDINIVEKPWQTQVQNLRNNIELKHKDERRKPKNYLDEQANSVARIFDLIKDQHDLSLVKQDLFHQVAQFGNQDEFIVFLRNQSFDVNETNQDGLTVLQSCVKNRNSKMVTTLLDVYAQEISKENLKATLFDLVSTGNKTLITLIKDHPVFLEQFKDIHREETREFCANLRKENKHDNLKQTIAEIEATLFSLSPKKTKTKQKSPEKDRTIVEKSMEKMIQTIERKQHDELIEDTVARTVDDLADWTAIKNTAKELGKKQIEETSSQDLENEQEFLPFNIKEFECDDEHIPRPIILTKTKKLNSDLSATAQPFVPQNMGRNFK